MPKNNRGEPPCRSCSTLTVVLIAVLTGVLPGGAGELVTSSTVPTSAVASSS